MRFLEQGGVGGAGEHKTDFQHAYGRPLKYKVLHVVIGLIFAQVYRFGY